MDLFVPVGREQAFSTVVLSQIPVGNRPCRAGGQPSDGDPGGGSAPGNRRARHLKNLPSGVEPAMGGPGGPPPVHLAAAATCSVSSPGIEPGLQPSEGRVRSSTLQGRMGTGLTIEDWCCPVAVLDHTARPPPSAQNRSSVLARNRTWSTTFAKSRAIQHTPRTDTEYPAEDSNLVQRFRRPSCFRRTRRVHFTGQPGVGPHSLDSSSVFHRRRNCRSRSRTGPSGLMRASGHPHLQ